MLRRKLLLILGPLVVLLVMVAVGAIWMLQVLLQQMNHVHSQAWTTVEQVHELGTTISGIEVDLAKLHTGQQRHLDGLIDRFETLRMLVNDIGNRYVAQEEGCAPCYRRLKAALPAFERHVGALATAQDPTLAARHNQAAIEAAVELRQEALAISQYARGHADLEQKQLLRDFRNVVFALAVIFLIVINASVLILLRMAGIILRPVEQLTKASKLLAEEHFDHRVKVEQNDEFDELARAYNHLAEQLQTNEQRKIEMLGQVALTLNHELNNAMATIGLQLQLMERQSGGNPASANRLRQIHESLQRMTRTVEQLKHVRRVVLTDYISGMKMLDLERSTQEPEPEPAGAGSGA